MTKFAELASVSDAELVRRARDSSSPEERHAAFMEIYGRHLEGVSWVCGRMLRETDSALDAIEDTFTAAYEDLCLKEAEVRELGAWLTGIAKRRCYPYMRGEKSRTGHRLGPDMLLVDDYDISATTGAGDEAGTEDAVRRSALRADAERLVAMVTATLTERQLRIHELSFREDLSGQELAKRLAVTAEQAARLKNETRNLLMNGIGALVLAQSGRAFCPILAEILDDAQWDGENFSARLRQRIVRHFDTCPTCDNCSTCAAKQQELGKQLIPVLIPMLFAEMLHARIRDAIRQSASWVPDRPGRPESGPPAPPPAVSRPRSRRPGGLRTGSPGNGRASRSGKRPPGRARRLSRGSSPGLIRAIAIIAGAAIAAGIAIPLIIHHPSRSGARAAVAAADVVAVHACSAQSAGQVHIPSAPRFTRLPAPVRLPEQAQVFGGIPDIGEKSSNVIAPSDMTCRLDVGGADSGGYVYLSKADRRTYR